MNLLVSVIIPTYKRPETLKRAILSVLQQTYKNFEIIVVDDNDPLSKYRLETEKLMDEWSDYENIKYIKHSSNKNGAAARNTGIKVSNGDYLAFLDDDDEFLPDKLKNQVNILESKDDTWGACYSSYIKLNKDNKIQKSSESREGNLYVEALMRSIYLGSGSNLMVRKSVVDEIKGFDESFYRNQDLEFLVRILFKYKLAYVNSCDLLVHYEVRDTRHSYRELKKIDDLYKEKFGDKINNLETSKKNKVYTMIALDNFRNSIMRKSIYDGFLELKKNKVSLMTLLKFLIYLVKRKLKRTSYGFEIK